MNEAWTCSSAEFAYDVGPCSVEQYMVYESMRPSKERHVIKGYSIHVYKAIQIITYIHSYIHLAMVKLDNPPVDEKVHIGPRDRRPDNETSACVRTGAPRDERVLQDFDVQQGARSTQRPHIYRPPG